MKDFLVHFDIWNKIEKKKFCIFFHFSKIHRGDPYDFDQNRKGPPYEFWKNAKKNVSQFYSRYQNGPKNPLRKSFPNLPKSQGWPTIRPQNWAILHQ